MLSPTHRPLASLLASAVVILVAGLVATDGPIRAAGVAPAAPGESSLAVVAGEPIADGLADLSAGLDLEPLQAQAFAAMEATPAWAWDIAALAEELDYDPHAAYEFVRDHVAYEPYAGSLRGAAGTLDARAGNAIDRSLLLAALLDEMHVPYRFAEAELDATATALVLTRALEGAAQPLDAPPLGPADAIVGRASRDYARLRGLLAEGGFHDLPSVTSASAAAAADAADHVWVQMAFGAEWRDLDTTLPDAAAGDVLQAPDRISPTVGDREPWVVELRVVAELLDAGRLREETVLSQQFDPRTAIDSDVFLFFRPDVEGLAGALIDVITGDEGWAPVLLIDGEETVGGVFSVGGRGTDLLGDETELPELAGLYLDVAVSGPGSASSGRHVILDRVPTGLRAGEEPIEDAALDPLEHEEGAPLPLLAFHHVIVSNGSTDLRRHLGTRAVAAGFLASLVDEEEAAAYELADRLWPWSVADRGLVVASEQLAVPGAAAGGAGRSFVASPRVYVTSLGVDPQRSDRTIAQVDLLIDAVRVLHPDAATSAGADAGDSAPGWEQLWYGTLETAIESEFMRNRRSADPAGEGEPAELVGVAFEMAGPLTLLEPGTDVAGPAALRSALDAGSFVVVPGDAASDEAVAADAWWTIDPETGVTRSVIEPGYGGVSQRADADREDARVLDGYLSEVSRRRSIPMGPNGGRPRALRPPPGSSFKPPPGGGAPCGSTQEYTTVASCVSLRTAWPAALFSFALSFAVEALAIQIAWGW